MLLIPLPTPLLCRQQQRQQQQQQTLLQKESGEGIPSPWSSPFIQGGGVSARKPCLWKTAWPMTNMFRKIHQRRS